MPWNYTAMNDFMTLEEALKIVAEKPDESNSAKQKLAIVIVQQFLDSLYYD